MNIFIDCGTHLGEGLAKFIERYKMTADWKIFSFEPNPVAYQQAIAKEYGAGEITFINKAVWINEGRIKFHAETPPASSRSDGEGSSLISLDDWTPKSAANPGVGEFSDTYEVECLRLADFIKSEAGPQDFVVVKMDIEGAEFAVLDDLVKSGAIRLIDHLYVEYHDWAMKSKNAWSKLLIKLRLRLAQPKLKQFEWQ